MTRDVKMIVTHLSIAARALVLFVGMSAFLYGCQGAVEQPQGGPQASSPAIAAPEVPPAVSVNDLMVGLVGRAANELWSVEQEGRAPRTDEDWQKLEHHAIQLVSSGTLTALGGTGQADPAWARQPDWNKYSQQMSDVGLAALEAVRRKDLDALITVNGRIGDVCQSCHQAMMP